MFVVTYVPLVLPVWLRVWVVLEAAVVPAPCPCGGDLLLPRRRHTPRTPGSPPDSAAEPSRRTCSRRTSLPEQKQHTVKYNKNANIAMILRCISNVVSNIWTF